MAFLLGGTAQSLHNQRSPSAGAFFFDLRNKSGGSQGWLAGMACDE
jgi:hypothetical protein